MMLVTAFAGGVVFSTVLGIAARRRRFDQLSVPQFAAWGAVGGLLLSMLPAVGGAVEGTASAGQAAGIMALVSMLSAASASGSLLLARLAEDRALLDASEEVGEVGLSGDEARKLLGGGG